MKLSNCRDPKPMVRLLNLLFGRFSQAISVFGGNDLAGYKPAAVPVRVPSRRSQR